jgi:hypothetical protein
LKVNASIFFLAWLMSLGTPAPAGPAGPANAPQAAPAKIKLDISARDELKGVIRQLLTRELQSRSPVQLVENDADWTIAVVTTELKDANGVTAAVGLSFVVEQHGIHMKMLLALAQACRYFIATGLMKDAPLEGDMRMLLQGVETLPKPESLAVVAQHKMCVITPNQLAQACHDVIMGFDAQRLGIAADAQPSPKPNPPAAPVQGK